MAVKADKSPWFDEMLAEGDWGEIRMFTKGYLPQQGRLKNVAGELVDSDSRAKSLEEYHSKLQSAVHSTIPAENPVLLGNFLPVKLGPVQVIAAAKKLKCRKAPGPDGVPGEF